MESCWCYEVELGAWWSDGRSSSSVSQFLPSCSWSACQMPVKELRSELRHFPSTDLQDMSLNTTDNNLKESWRSRIHSNHRIGDHKLYCHLQVKPQHHRCTHISAMIITHPKPLPAFLSMSCSALVSSSCSSGQECFSIKSSRDRVILLLLQNKVHRNTISSMKDIRTCWFTVHLKWEKIAKWHYWWRSMYRSKVLDR